MFRTLLVSLVALFAAIAGSGLAAGAASDPTAAPVLARIVKSGELRVGMTGDQAPLNMKSKSGRIIGLEPDIAEVLANSMQVKLRIVPIPFAELLDALEAGKVDLVMSGLTITPERNMRAAFVGPYFVSGKSILTRNETLAAIEQASDIDSPDVKLAALDESTSERFVQLVLPRTKLQTVPSYEQGVKLVLDGKVDALVADYPICLLSVLRHPDKGLSTLLSPLTLEPIGIALPANDPLFVNLVRNYLATLQATGVLERLRSRWLESSGWLDQLP